MNLIKVASLTLRTYGSQFVDQVGPHSAAVVCTSNCVSIDSPTQWMVLEPGSSCVEAYGCISMPSQRSTLIGEQCVTLHTICDHHCLVSIGLEQNKESHHLPGPLTGLVRIFAFVPLSPPPPPPPKTRSRGAP